MPAGSADPPVRARIICRRLLAGRVRTIDGFDDPRFARRHRALLWDLQQAVLLAGASPEDEQRKDIWNTVVLGHGRRRVIDFTGISQPWLREALKQWTAEELPTRRGDHATSILQSHVRRVEELSSSLRLSDCLLTAVDAGLLAGAAARAWTWARRSWCR